MSLRDSASLCIQELVKELAARPDNTKLVNMVVKAGLLPEVKAGLKLRAEVRGLCIQGCQFSDFLEIKESGIKLIKYGKNIDKMSIVSKDRLDSGKGLDNPCLNTVSKH